MYLELQKMNQSILRVIRLRFTAIDRAVYNSINFFDAFATKNLLQIANKLHSRNLYIDFGRY